MPYLHQTTHADDTKIDPQILLSHYPTLYRWVSIPADCQRCHLPISALIRRANNHIYALACPACSGEELTP